MLINKNAIVVLFSFVLAACLPSKIMVVPDAESFTTIPVGQGIVAVQLIDTDSSINLDSIRLAPKDVNESDENQFVQIEARKISTEGTTTYIGVVPEGQYSISLFKGVEILGQLIFTRVLPGDPSVGTFQVKTGHLTNLGTLIGYAKPRGKIYEMMLTRSGDFPEAATIIRDELSDLAASAQNLDDPIRWDEDGLADERRQTYLNIVQNPLSLKRWQMLDDELVVLSTTGGMLRSARADGWIYDFVESDHPVTMIDRNSSGDQIASAEGSNLFAKLATSADWQRVAAPPGSHLIAAMIDSSGRAYVVDRQQAALVLYQSDSLEQPNWQATLVYRQKFGWLLAAEDRAEQQRIATEEAARAAKKSTKGTVEKRRKRRKVPGEIDEVAATLVGDNLVIMVKGRTYSVTPAAASAVELDVPKKFKNMSSNGDLLIASWESSMTADGASRYHWAKNLAGPWTQVKHRLDVCPGERGKSSERAVCANNKTRKYRSYLLEAEPILTPNGNMYAVMKSSPGFQATKWILGISEDMGQTWKSIDDNEEFFVRCDVLLPGSTDSELLVGCDATDGKIHAYDVQTKALSLRRAPTDF